MIHVIRTSNFERFNFSIHLVGCPPRQSLDFRDHFLVLFYLYLTPAVYDAFDIRFSIFYVPCVCRGTHISFRYEIQYIFLSEE